MSVKARVVKQVRQVELPWLKTSTAFFSLDIPREHIWTIPSLYSGWVLGLGEFAGRRQRRISSGVNKAWQQEYFNRSQDLDGLNGLRVRIRRMNQGFMIHLVEMDAFVPQKVWENMVVFKEVSGRLRLEHSVRHSVPEPRKIHLHISDRHEDIEVQNSGVDVTPSVLRVVSALRGVQSSLTQARVKSAIPICADQVEAFVSEEVFSLSRRDDIVLVTPRGESDFFVDFQGLAKNLELVSRVFYFADRESSYGMSKILKDADAKMLACFDGGARIYPTGLSSKSDPRDSRLYLGDTLSRFTPEQNAKRIADRLHQVVVRRNMPEDCWLSVRKFDRETQAHSLVLASGQREGLESLEQFRESNEDLSGKLKKLSVENQELWNAYEQADQLCKKIEQESEEKSERFREDLEQKGFELDQLRRELEQKSLYCKDSDQRFSEQKRLLESNSIPVEVRDAIEHCLNENQETLQVLTVINAIFPERVEILPEAWKSAEAHRLLPNLRGDQFKICWVLVTNYWTTLKNGGSDQVARQCFGKSYAAKESESTMRDAELKRQRTRVCPAGTEYLMEQHLKIGISGIEGVFRLHFSWDAKKGKIVIGHCGEHLGVSSNR